MNLCPILVLLLSWFFPLEAIQPEDLLAGDIIFWADDTANDRAGHVAVVTHASADVKQLRVAHSTDNPKYYMFIATYLPPSRTLQKFKKQYVVLRLTSDSHREHFNLLVKEWLTLGIPFNADHEKQMNRWDDAMPRITSATKAQLQHIIFTDSTRHAGPLPPDGFMCSEVIIEALQRVFSAPPTSLQLDPILCPPSTMIVSLSQDPRTFSTLGTLTVPDVEFTPHEKALFERTIASEVKQKREAWKAFVKQGSPGHTQTMAVPALQGDDGTQAHH